VTGFEPDRASEAPGSIEEMRDLLAGQRYLVDDGLATICFLALRVRRPLLVEGEPGVGKTELAKALAGAMGVPLLRLQCYEGIDVHHALYDWDYPRQLLHLRAGEPGSLYSEEFLLRRPLLEALSSPRSVLLIDELDRADDEFEAFLLEFLSDFQVSIPEVGVVAAPEPPTVIITSNRTRELHDALRRRCMYHWIDHPNLEREVEIVHARLPEIPEGLVRQACAFVEQLRWLELYRLPGVGETLDWVQALHAFGDELDERVADRALGSLLKGREDQEAVRREGIAALLERARERSEAGEQDRPQEAA
jgi:MoxR-like ATPase